MTYNEFKKFAEQNYIWGRTVRIGYDALIYTFALMFRENKRPPEEIKVIVSFKSKNVLRILSDRRQFASIEDAINKMRKS